MGLATFAKISAVEGIALTGDMKKDFREFDSAGFSAEERRAAIIRKYGRNS